MAVYFESAGVHLSNCLPKGRDTSVILSVEIDLEVNVKNQKQKIAALQQKYYSTVGGYPIENQKNQVKKYCRFGEWEKLRADEHQHILDDSQVL